MSELNLFLLLIFDNFIEICYFKVEVGINLEVILNIFQVFLGDLFWVI